MRSLKPGLPVSTFPIPRRLEQVMSETAVMLNSRSFSNEIRSGEPVALTLCTSMVLLVRIW